MSTVNMLTPLTCVGCGHVQAGLPPSALLFNLQSSTSTLTQTHTTEDETEG